MRNNPDTWLPDPNQPSLLMTFFSHGWKQRVFSQSGNNRQRFVQLTKTVISSQAAGVLLMTLMAFFFGASVGVPAFLAGCYTLVTLNNSLDYEINPLIRALDSHGMSFVMSFFLLSAIYSSGQLIGFFGTLLFLIASLPFLFDGALGVISISRQRNFVQSI